MAYQALARKYRPQTFSDILGQESIVRTLTNAIEQKRIHQAYVLSGVRGVGKTTTARIVAKALNCVKGPTAQPCNECSICREITEGIDLDVREIDAATYTGVDNIRELREVTQFQPARDRYRIFIIDEAHMLSGPAWNALLKTIEEPPPHVIFMMATTEMHKVPQTILSRVQQFIFRKITPAEVVARLEEICRAEGIEAEREALEIIARRGEGSVRDSLSLLDQIVAFSGRSISAADVATILGLADNRFFGRLVEQIHDGDPAGILETLEEAAESGRDFKLLFRDLLSYIRALLVLASGATDSLLPLPPGEIDALRALAQRFAYSELLRILNLLVKDDDLVNRSEQQRLAVEIAILKAATFPRMREIESLLGGDASPSALTRPAARPRSPAATREGSASKEQFVEQLRGQKRMTATYVEQAKSFRVDGDAITIEYEPAQSFIIEYLAAADQTTLLESVASELWKRPMKVRIETEGAKEEPARQARTPLQEDPVVQAFAKHLGGEVIPQKKRATEER